ncbi:DeoR family transcriptional regulator [Thalassospira xiamenensis]|uniref:DeoR/GlpR family DNA-binding transcription regulator n=1 Tax=Thalassospira xiamenensis TaxID=220697 RepID=UPI000DEDF446|nr:DeoR family transcriptional regulator [Thalassospira xiamenensis]RCK33181.1 DeoR family transcriptional regulator [Thalassospira xiamenensis]
MGKLDRRRREILELVAANSFMTIDTLADHFAVTPQTIRRDINEMAEEGLVARYHGGAASLSTTENTAYTDRQVLNLGSKREIAKLVAQHIPEGASIFINIGTTNEEVARALSSHKSLKIITNNLHVAQICAANPGFEVIIAGGVVRQRDFGVIGEATIDFINQFKVDYAIVGISGVDEDGSLMDFDYREVRVARAIISNARQTFLCTDASKFGRRAMVRLGHLSEIDALFTDRHPGPVWTDVIREADVSVYTAN